MRACLFVVLYQGQALAADVTAWLREHGFDPAGVYCIAHDSLVRAIQADFYFRRCPPPDRRNAYSSG